MGSVLILLIIIFLTIVLFSILFEKKDHKVDTVVILKCLHVFDRKKDIKHSLERQDNYSIPSHIDIASLSTKIPFFYELLIKSCVQEDQEQVQSMSTDAFFQKYLEKRKQYRDEGLEYFCSVKQVNSVTFFSFLEHKDGFCEVSFIIESDLVRYMKKDGKVIKGSKTPSSSREEWAFRMNTDAKKDMWKIHNILPR